MTTLMPRPAVVEASQYITWERGRSLTSRFSGISVSNTPDKNADAVADLSIFLMLGALRQITIAQKALKQGMFVFQ
jgi:phosphoglycerate dehydrogenase-like enzyme